MKRFYKEEETAGVRPIGSGLRPPVITRPDQQPEPEAPVQGAGAVQAPDGQPVQERPKGRAPVEDPRKEKKKKKSNGKPKKNGVRRAFIALGVILLVLLLAVGCVWAYLFAGTRLNQGPIKLPDSFLGTEKNNQKDSGNGNEGEEGLAVPYDKELTNILLIGVDSRDPNEIYTNSDTMIVLTLDQRKNVIKMTSFQRDMLLKISGTDRFNKVNSAMYGGPDNLMRTLNYNFKLDLSQYIIVNFLGAEQIVNLVGGVTIDVPDDENQLRYLNSIIWDTNKELGGEWCPPVERGGYQLLNGRQAIAFARMRKLDSDFNRMSRQHEVLQQVFRRFKDVNPIKKLQVLRAGLQMITTNLSETDLLGIATSAVTKIDKPIETLKVPMDGYYEPAMIGGTSYIIPYVNKLIEPVHEFIYGTRQGDDSHVDEYLDHYSLPTGPIQTVPTGHPRETEESTEWEDHSWNTYPTRRGGYHEGGGSGDDGYHPGFDLPGVGGGSGGHDNGFNPGGGDFGGNTGGNSGGGHDDGGNPGGDHSGGGHTGGGNDGGGDHGGGGSDIGRRS